MCQTKKEQLPRAKNFETQEKDLILELFAEHDTGLRSQHNNDVSSLKKRRDSGGYLQPCQRLVCGSFDCAANKKITDGLSVSAEREKT